jgi:hypothetical protein
VQEDARVSGDPLEIEEREALLADIERQIVTQQRLIEALRDAGRPTHRDSHVLVELHQKADRQRDYLRVLREGLVIVPR